MKSTSVLEQEKGMHALGQEHPEPIFRHFYSTTIPPCCSPNVLALKTGNSNFFKGSEEIGSG